MQLLQQLWVDERGAVLSAEVATVATVGVMSTVVGLNAMSDAVNGELRDLSQSFRSLDQSYHYAGFRSCRAWYAGSCFQQRPVDHTLRDMCGPHRPEHWERREHRLEWDDPRGLGDRRDDDKPRSEKRGDDDDKPRQKSDRKDDDDGQAFESIDTPVSEKL